MAPRPLVLPEGTEGPIEPVPCPVSRGVAEGRPQMANDCRKTQSGSGVGVGVLFKESGLNMDHPKDKINVNSG